MNVPIWLMSWGKGLAVFALDPHSIHCHLLPTIHLQAPINQILDFFQPGRCEENIQFIYEEWEKVVKKAKCFQLTLIFIMA